MTEGFLSLNNCTPEIDQVTDPVYFLNLRVLCQDIILRGQQVANVANQDGIQIWQFRYLLGKESFQVALICVAVEHLEDLLILVAVCNNIQAWHILIYSELYIFKHPLDAKVPEEANCIDQVI